MSGDLRALAEAATPGPWGWDAWKRQPTAEPTACVTAGAHDLAVLNGCPVEPGDDDEGWLTRWMQDREAAAHADAAYIAAANPAAILALLDERDALARWKAEALPLLDGLQELGRALDLPLGEQVTGRRAAEAAAALRAERDGLRGQL